jgi:ABC-2 type transport system permease protein
MSSAAASSPRHVAAPAPAPALARWRRPSTLTVYRWELRKLVSQKRTYLGLALSAILPVVFVIVENLRQRPRHGGESIFASEITRSGLATPVLMLTFLVLFMLPLVASLVAGDVVANEDGNGTLKTILTRSVDRGQVYAAKAMAALSYATIAVFLSAAVATLAGVASWGFHSLTSLSGTVVSAPEALLLIVASNAIYLMPLFAVASVGVLLSTATRNSAAAVVAAIGLVILLDILASIPGLEGIRPYLLTQQFEAWQGLLRTPTDWAPIAHSAWVSALYAVPALLAGYLVFLRRDVAGG